VAHPERDDTAVLSKAVDTFRGVRCDAMLW
jgi:hypothetical protein